MMKRTSVKKAAIISDGRRPCSTCQFFPCSEQMGKFCTDTYINGFVKGVQWQKRNEKAKSQQTRDTKAIVESINETS